MRRTISDSSREAGEPPATSTAKALRKSAVARYLQLASLFRRRIDTGEWPVGSQIPTVEVLARECGVASMTIRQALDILEADGLVERFRAKGTFVRERPKRQLWCEVQTDWNGLLIARDGSQIEILSDMHDVTLPQHDPDIGQPAPAYRHLRRLHSRAGVAFLIADVYVDERVCRHIPETAYQTVTAMRLVADLPGQKIIDARQEMTLGAADLETASKLDIPLGDPVAFVKRTVVNAEGTLILVANGTYRGDMVKVEVKLR